MSPLYAKMLSRQAAEVLREVGGDILELGAGDGRLAGGIISDLSERGVRCDYKILETSSALRHRQESYLGDKAEWLSELPSSFTGVILANEVLDAVPFGVYTKRGGEWYERGVSYKGGELCWSERELSDAVLLKRFSEMSLPDGYPTEASLLGESLTSTLCELLSRGLLLLSDYGFGRSEYYHPERVTGTLMCHRGHQSDSEPLLESGLKDITSHVDFTSIAEAGLSGGAKLVGYTTQAHFLLNCGILESLSLESSDLDVSYARLSSGAQRLLGPHEMGELFKFMGLTKGEIAPLLGFSGGCRLRQL